MGMYDTLNFVCPGCGQIVSEQSKAGECNLRTYSLDTAPLVVIADINTEGKSGRLSCGSCGVQLELEVRCTVTPRIRNSRSTEKAYRVV